MLHNLQKLSKTTCGQNVPSSLPFGLSLSQQTADGLLLRIGSRPSARQGWNILITQYNPKLLTGITYKRQSTLVQPQCMISSYGYHQHSVTCSTSTIFCAMFITCRTTFVAPPHCFHDCTLFMCPPCSDLHDIGIVCTAVKYVHSEIRTHDIADKCLKNIPVLYGRW